MQRGSTPCLPWPFRLRCQGRRRFREKGQESVDDWRTVCGGPSKRVWTWLKRSSSACDIGWHAMSSRDQRKAPWHNIAALDAAQAPQPYSHLRFFFFSLLHHNSLPHPPIDKNFSPNGFHSSLCSHQSFSSLRKFRNPEWPSCGRAWQGEARKCISRDIDKTTRVSTSTPALALIPWLGPPPSNFFDFEIWWDMIAKIRVEDLRFAT